MKKSLLALVIFAAFTLASCASYTCPTYGKAPAKTKPVASQTTKI
jgi:PBP1b-binding outer membrane lipoprotein LpoB